ncbi:MAG: hypothetical protein H7249_05950 [Chitinophagaceae bacterium]|nr:hypothetical protein [Oligoflexus sp.]
MISEQQSKLRNYRRTLKSLKDKSSAAHSVEDLSKIIDESLQRDKLDIPSAEELSAFDRGLPYVPSQPVEIKSNDDNVAEVSAEDLTNFSAFEIEEKKAALFREKMGMAINPSSTFPTCMV